MGTARGDSLPTDGLSAIQTTRYSMQSQRSFEGALPHSGGGHGHRRSVSNGSVVFSPRSPRGDREGLMHGWDAEQQAFGLADLAEDSEGEERAGKAAANGVPGTAMNGSHTRKPD